MSNTKRIVAGALGLVTALSLVATAAVLTASAQSANYNFTQNLTVGSSGPSVTALQELLASKGFFTVTPTGYFGAITKAAVAAWQASAGLPSTGFFGPLSRAAVNSMAMTGGTTTTTTTSFNCPTGWVCTAPAPVSPTCPAGYTCTSAGTTATATTCPAGYTCTANAGVTSSTNEGTLNLTLAGTPSNQTNIQTDINVPVWGLQAQAQLGDVTIQRLDLDVQDQVQSGSPYLENPGNFINNIQIVDQSTGTVLGSWNTNVGSFVQGTTSSDYYIRLSGFNFTIPNGQTKTMVVNFSTNGGIDTSRNLTIVGYGSTGLQTLSGGIADYYNISGSSFTRTQQFSQPGNTTVTFGIDPNTPPSQTFQVLSQSGLNGAPVLKFTVQATNANANINSITITPTQNTTTGTGAQDASTISILNGSTVIASQSVSGTSPVTFNNINNLVIPSGTTQSLTVTVNVPGFSTTVTGHAVVQLSLSGITYQSTTGQIYTFSPNVTGNAEYFYSASPNLAFLTAGTPTVVNTNPSNGSAIKTSSVGESLVLQTTPTGTMLIPLASDFIVKVGTSLGSAVTIPTASTSITVNGPNGIVTTGTLGQGGPYTINLTASINGNGNPANSLLAGSGNYYFYITSASTTVQDPNGNNINTVQTWGLSNFQSGSFYVAG